MSRAELIEPELTALRGSFHSRYSLAKEKRLCTTTGVRLLDCMLCVAPYGDPEYFDAPGAGEFAVVDVVTKEKAWFEMPHGCTPEMVTGMIESTFAATAYRVGNKLWFV